MNPFATKLAKEAGRMIAKEAREFAVANYSNPLARKFAEWAYIADAKAKAKKARKKGATIMEILFLVFVMLFGILVMTGCASVRARMWSAGSDWADELDGTDDVPSVIFETETDNLP